jgi:hypothetical protein
MRGEASPELERWRGRPNRVHRWELPLNLVRDVWHSPGAMKWIRDRLGQLLNDGPDTIRTICNPLENAMPSGLDVGGFLVILSCPQKVTPVLGSKWYWESSFTRVRSREGARNALT